jgi:hypothetical protein
MGWRLFLGRDGPGWGSRGAVHGTSRTTRGPCKRLSPVPGSTAVSHASGQVSFVEGWQGPCALSTRGPELQSLPAFGTACREGRADLGFGPDAVWESLRHLRTRCTKGSRQLSLEGVVGAPRRNRGTVERHLFPRERSTQGVLSDWQRHWTVAHTESQGFPCLTLDDTGFRGRFSGSVDGPGEAGNG